MGLPRASALVLFAIVVACNAINGSGDLAVCATCDDDGGAIPGRGGASSGTPAAGPDAASPDAALPASCNAGDKTCAGVIAAVCTGGAWQQTSCPETCVDGACQPYPSCRNNSGSGCGSSGSTGSCCETGSVAGGTFQRRSTASLTASVSDFRLDLYEVTVGRFRAFLDAGGATTASPPVTGSGANAKIPGSGWLATWNARLPASVASIKSSLTSANGTWTDTAGASEHKPINRVSYLLAFAFCAWDGARLPTYAEWTYAAAGGSDQRVYPWSVPSSSTTITSSRAAYDCGYQAPAYSCPASSCSDGSSSPCDTTTCLAPEVCNNPPCTGCSPSDIAPVGSLPLGKGKFGHFDLAGNVEELVLDPDVTSLPTPCIDCAVLPPADPGNAGSFGHGKDLNVLAPGGAWNDTSTTPLRTTSYDSVRWNQTLDNVGFRCARD